MKTTVLYCNVGMMSAIAQEGKWSNPRMISMYSESTIIEKGIGTCSQYKGVMCDTNQKSLIPWL